MKLCKKLSEVDEKELKKVETVMGTLYLKRLVREPAGHITIEDFPAGTTFTWTFWHDEVHYVMKGKAEITYSLPPLHLKEEKIVAEAGDVYLMYRGERVTWKIVSEEPYRHLCIIMPAVPLPTGDQLILEHYEKYGSP